MKAYTRGNVLTMIGVLFAFGTLARAQTPVVAFDSDNEDYLHIDPITVPAQHGTIEFWFAPDDAADSGQWNNRFDLMSGESEGGNNRFLLYRLDEKTLRFHCTPGGTANNETVDYDATGWPGGEFRHVALHFSDGDNEGLIRMFVDGVKIGEVTGMSGTMGSHTMLTFMADTPANDRNYASGRLADVRLWNVLRSEQELNDYRFSRLTGAELGLVGYWRLDEGSGDTAFDYSGNDHHGVIHVDGATWTTDASLVLAEPSGDFVPSAPLVLADSDTGSTSFTNDETVELVDVPVPDDYTHFQLTTDGEAAALGETWEAIANIPSSFTFDNPAPTAETLLTVYAWFTNTSENVVLRRGEGSLFYTAVPPVPVVHATLTAGRAEGEPGVIHPEMVDDGSTGGVADERIMAIEGLFVNLISGPDSDATPEEPWVTVAVDGDYVVTLTVTNEAGNAATSGEATVTLETVNVAEDAWFVALEGEPVGGGSADGRNWEFAFNTVQDAIDAAAPGETIYIAEGIYDLTAAINVTQSDITIIGGYIFDSGLPGTPGTAPTVLQRDASVAFMRIMQIENQSNVTVERVTLRNGRTNEDEAGGEGGGVRVVDSANITFRGCIVRNNQGGAPGRLVDTGGGFYIAGATSSLWIEDCIIRENDTTKQAPGGGICIVGGGSLTVTNSVVAFNKSAESTNGGGAGVRIANSQAVIVDTVIAFNWGPRASGGSQGQGYAVYINGASADVLLRNCLITGNYIAGWARTDSDNLASTVLVEGGTVTIANSTIAGNPQVGVHRTGGTALIRDSILWDNINDLDGNITLQNCNIEDGNEAGNNGNISADPRFERGFYLAAGSPSRGTGSQSVSAAGMTGYTTRADGIAAVGTDTVDMGYHYPAGINWDVADLYVSAGGSGDLSGSDADNTLSSIGAALALAETGTRIHIAPGNYTTAVESFPLAIEELDGIQLLGADAETTVINSAGSGSRAISVARSAGDNRLANLTLTNEETRVDLLGGALNINSTMLAITNCNFVDNWIGTSDPLRGGAIYGAHSVVTITDSLFRGNNARQTSNANLQGGGALAFTRSRLLADRCRFENNRAELHDDRSRNVAGGAMRLGLATRVGRYTVRNSLFIGNTVGGSSATYYGDAIAISSGYKYVAIENCTIVGSPNHAIGMFDATHVDRIALRNTVLWDNTADLGGDAAPGVIEHNTIDTGAGVDGNIAGDPLFEDAPAGNYRLLPESDAVGAGMLLAWMDDTALDLAGEPRTVKGLVDMGAYQYPFPPQGSLFLLR